MSTFGAVAQRKGAADWPSLGQWPMAGQNVDDMHFQAAMCSPGRMSLGWHRAGP